MADTRSFKAGIDVVRSYPSLRGIVSGEAVIHDLADQGIWASSALRLVRGFEVQIELPGIGLRTAEVTQADYPYFACAFTDAVPATNRRSVRRARFAIWTDFAARLRAFFPPGRLKRCRDRR